MFVYKFTMSNLVSVFPYALRDRIREKRIALKICNIKVPKKVEYLAKALS